MAPGSASNVLTDRIEASAGIWVPVPAAYRTVLNIYAETDDLLVSAGHSTPTEATSYKMPKGSSLEIRPVPIGQVFIMSVSTQTVYLIGS